MIEMRGNVKKNAVLFISKTYKPYFEVISIFIIAEDSLSQWFSNYNEGRGGIAARLT